MVGIDIINSVLKNIYINISIYVILIRLIDYKMEYKYDEIKKFCFIVGISIVMSCIYTILKNYIHLLLITIIIHSLYGIIISKIINKKASYSIILIFISFAIVYLIYTISILLSASILKIINSSIEINNPLILGGAIILGNVIMYFLLKVKRFKNGISFLKDNEKVSNMGIIGIMIAGIVILIYSIAGTYDNFMMNTYLFTGIIIECICLTIWIRRRITKYYKQKLKERTIEELEAELDEKNKELDKSLEESKRIATINHKYSSRIQALERFSEKIKSNTKIMEDMKTEFGEDFGDFAEQIKKLSEEYSNEMEKTVKHDESLEKTGIFGIDNILEYMKEEANKNNIKFNLKINGNINYMVERVIQQSKLETLLADHIKDAIIAINSSNNTYKSILTIIGIIDNCYEVSIYDTGIEFEIETLLKLGLETITTHKETGGTGIGFITTFETLKSTKASLIIEEKHPMNNKDYTKVVIIRFDGKNEYKIRSYRANKIRKENNSSRIIIESI